MKKILIGIISLFLILVIYKFYEVKKAIEPDPKFNTVYTEKFESNEFESIKVGNKINYVIDKIGEPFRVDTIKSSEYFLYTNSDENVFFIEGSNLLRFNGGIDSLKYSNISLNQNGDITNIFADFDLGGRSNEELMRLNKNKLIELFGKPQQSMNCDCNCIVFSYSRLKDGPYRGKRPKINLKKILFVNDKVKGKIDIEGNPYNPYIGICEITKN